MLPAGEHTIVMRFRPRSVILGGAVSLLAFMAIAVGLISELRKHLHARPDAKYRIGYDSTH